MDQAPALQVHVVGIDVGRPNYRRWNLAAAGQLELDLQRTTDLPGDLILDREHVFEFAIECVRPQVIAVFGVEF